MMMTRMAKLDSQARGFDLEVSFDRWVKVGRKGTHPTWNPFCWQKSYVYKVCLQAVCLETSKLRVRNLASFAPEGYQLARFSHQSATRKDEKAQKATWSLVERAKKSAKRAW